VFIYSYAECRYAECHGAIQMSVIVASVVTLIVVAPSEQIQSHFQNVIIELLNGIQSFAYF
jgi:hypothetical protein